MDRTIRQAGHHEAEILASLIRQSFADVAQRFHLTRDNCPNHPSNCTSEWIERDLAKGKRYFLLDVDGHSVGCVAITCLDGQAGEIERLAVLPGARCRAYGDTLLRHAMLTLGELGMSRAQLGIIAEHTDLQAWYERRGFVLMATKVFPHLPFAVGFMSMDIQ